MSDRIFCIFLAIFFYCTIFSEVYADEVQTKHHPRLKITKPDAVMRLPDIAFYDSSGQKVYFEQFEGKKLLLTFWATWCTPCASELPTLDTLKRDFKKLPIEILAISEDFHPIDIIQSFYEQKGIRSIDIYRDRGNELFKAMSISGLPTTFFVDEDGVIKLIIVGGINWDLEEMRLMLIEYIGGDFALPKNTSNKISLNNTTNNIVEEKKAPSNMDIISNKESTSTEQNDQTIDSQEDNKLTPKVLDK